MKLTVFSGRANPPLAESVASSLGLRLGQRIIETFPDDELYVRIDEDVKGHNVYLIQPTNPPVADHLLELLLLSDACRRAGAERITAVTPYFGYARQERRVKGSEPVAARLMADLMGTRVDRVIAVDLHNPAVEGFFSVPVENLSAVPLLAGAIRPHLIQGQTVLVAPDLGAVKLVQRYADILNLPVAYIHKVRGGTGDVSVRSVIGDVKGRRVLIVDDMISTGGTMVSAIEAVMAEGCEPGILVAAVHALMAGDAAESLARLPLDRILVTDSLRIDAGTTLPLEVAGLGPMLADAIKRLHGKDF